MLTGMDGNEKGERNMKDFMKMSEPIQKAYQIAKKAHAGQKDKAGKDYIYHPMTVASNVGDDETAIIVGLLHDTVEDTDVTMQQLAKEFSPDVIAALKLLTHDKTTPYLDYVQKIKDSGNEAARKVKLADLHMNMDLSRFPDGPTPKDKERVQKKYIPALKILEG
jgi:(p)ppGpp synthase/HD superfamily hydrolase